MIVGLPGAGISGLFYLVCAFVMPFNGAWRALRGNPPSPAEWRRIVFAFVIALIIVAMLVASAMAVSALFAPVAVPSIASSGDGMSTAASGVPAPGGLPEPIGAFLRLGAAVTIGTLLVVLLSVRLLALFFGRNEMTGQKRSAVVTPHVTPPEAQAQTGAQRVLITGGAGFIGSHIADAYVRDGWHVTVLDDLSSGDRTHVPAAAHLIVADIADPGTIDRVADARPDLVIHAAAQISVTASMRDRERDLEVNVVGTQHVLEGAARAGAGRFVFISSGGAVYGETTGASEQSVPTPMNPYGIHKLAAEGYVRVSGLSYAILRLANVYGPRQRAGLEGGVVAIFTDAIPGGRPVTVYGTGRQVRDFVNVRDVVAAVRRASARHRDGTWNVGTGSTVSVIELVARIGGLAGLTPNVTYAPARTGDVEESRLMFDRAWRDLGWSPSVGLDEGLRELVQRRAVDRAIKPTSRNAAASAPSLGAPGPGA